MKRLVYISTARVALRADELDGILAASRRNNAVVNVTGLLVAGGRRFLQALEGPDLPVATVFQRIARDPRHFAIVTLSDTAIDKRMFGTWAMGHAAGGVSREDRRTLPEIVGDLIAPIEDPNLRAYFSEFAVQHAAAA